MTVEIDPLNCRTTTTYDALGRPVTVLDCKGQLCTYTHNARGELIGLVCPDGWRVTITYNGRGEGDPGARPRHHHL